MKQSSVNAISRTVMTLVVLLGVVLCLAAAPSHSAAVGKSKGFPKPNYPLEKMDPVDACLFICPDCYEDPLLLDCANKVCLTDVLMGNKIDNFWLEDCPGLKRLPQGK